MKWMVDTFGLSGALVLVWLAMGLLYGAFFNHHVRSQSDPELLEGTRRYRQSPWLAYLPCYCAFVLFISLVSLSGLGDTAYTMLALCLSPAVSISVYFTLMLLLLPWLRRHFSAALCAELWVLPNLLYIMMQAEMGEYSPFSVELLWLRGDILAVVWAGGTLAVLVWKIAGHIAFRRQILRDAAEESDASVLALWRQEQTHVGFTDRDITLARSPHVATPLSIGFFPATLRVVLPQREYSEEELSLIFRHELVHISRSDGWGKFFLVFCAALCWFNPLMWVAMRRSAEDMELSCDEAVLRDADATDRRRYSQLLLRTAGDERGFTTCLAASAGALRYRMSRVFNPGKRRIGSLLAGVGVALLLMLSAVRMQVVFAPVSWQRATELDAPVTATLYRGNDDYPPADQEVLFAYLESLDWCCTVGYSDNARAWTPTRLSIREDTWKGQHITIAGDLMVLGGVGSAVVGGHCYYCPQGVDWEYIETLFSS